MADLPDKSKLDEVRSRAIQQPPANKPANPPVDKPADKPVDSVNDDKPIDKPADIISIDKIDDDAFLKEVERRGIKVVKETLTPEQQKRQADLEEADKLKIAIENGLITPEAYAEAKAIIVSDGFDLTKREFTKAHKEANPKATKEEIDAAFNDYYNVQQVIKVKEKKLQKDDDGEFEVEVDVDKPKYDEQHVKWGEQRIKTKAERIKENAKAVLANVDNYYNNWKIIEKRAAEYSKDIESVISQTDFAAYPTKHKISNKEISAIVKFPKPDEIKAEVTKYLQNDLASIALRGEKNPEVSEIKRQVNSFLRERFPEHFEETIWNLGKTEGINEAKTGSSSPIERPILSDDSRVDELPQEIKSRIPVPKDSPLLNR